MPPVFVLYAWPVIVAILFGKPRVPAALLISVTVGYLFLPEQTKIDINIDSLPPLNKHSIPVLAALVMAFFIGSRIPSGQSRPGWMPQSWVARLLLVGLVFGMFMTTLTNGDVLVYGPRFIPGMTVYDSFSLILNAFIAILPFFLARKFLATPEAHRTFLVVLCITGLIYSLLALFEVRMSPQLNRMFYGFFPHSWVQHIRGDGFRPIVFLEHGLWVAIFFSAAILAVIGLLRLAIPSRRKLFVGAAIWLLVTLVLVKSLGALIITLLLAPVILFTGVRIQFLVAGIVAIFVLTYPLARGVGLVPTTKILGIAQSINPLRASSLNTRFTNEDALLAKAQKRVMFGWGGYGRSRVYAPNGRDITLQDGQWIIIMGQGGWTRYLTEFGLLTIPIILLMWRRRKYGIGMETSVLAIILAGNLLDLLPNATSTSLTWMFVGALWGRLEMQKIEEIQASEPVMKPTFRRERMGAREDYLEKQGTQQRREKAGATPSNRPTEERLKYARPGNKLHRRNGPTE